MTDSDDEMGLPEPAAYRIYADTERGESSLLVEEIEDERVGEFYDVEQRLDVRSEWVSWVKDRLDQRIQELHEQRDHTFTRMKIGELKRLRRELETVEDGGEESLKESLKDSIKDAANGRTLTVEESRERLDIKGEEEEQ